MAIVLPHQTVFQTRLPPDITPVMDSQTGTAGAQVVATLPAAVGVTTFMTHFTVTAAQVAAVVSGTVTVVGPSTTLNYILVETVSAGGYIQGDFDPPIPASAPNTTIVITVPTIGGGSNVAIMVYGYQG